MSFLKGKIDFGWFVDNAVPLVHSIILGICWVLPLAVDGDNATAYQNDVDRKAALIAAQAAVTQYNNDNAQKISDGDLTALVPPTDATFPAIVYSMPVYWAIQYFYFFGWFIHWHLTFSDTDCKRSVAYGFHNVMAVLHFAAIVKDFTFWESVGSDNMSNYSIVITVFQLLSLIIFQFNNFIGLFTDKTNIKID